MIKRFNQITKPRKSLGFTLIEVLVALSVLAISALAVIRQTGSSLADTRELEQKTIALMIAENQINLVHVAEVWPPIGRSSDIITYAGQQWELSTEVEGTNDPWLRRVEVTVHKSVAGEEYPIASLVSYRGRY